MLGQGWQEGVRVVPKHTVTSIFWQKKEMQLTFLSDSTPLNLRAVSEAFVRLSVEISVAPLSSTVS